MLTGEAPAAESAVLYAENYYLPYVLGTSLISPVEILEEALESAAANALDVRVDEALS